MVCDRCKFVVEAELKKLGFYPMAVELGEVVLNEKWLSKGDTDAVDDALKKLGFELIDNKNARIIEKIKNTVIEIVHYKENPPTLKHSEMIAAALHLDYPYLSKLFSEVEGVTIEHYIIRQKIERVKELLVYDELNLSQIADKLGYSSVAHLSAQFKKATGLPPSHFKNLGVHQRKSLDKLGS